MYTTLLLGLSRGPSILGVYGKGGVYGLCRVQKSFPANKCTQTTKAQPSAAPHRGASRPCGVVLCADVAGIYFCTRQSTYTPSLPYTPRMNSPLEGPQNNLVYTKGSLTTGPYLPCIGAHEIRHQAVASEFCMSYVVPTTRQRKRISNTNNPTMRPIRPT